MDHLVGFGKYHYLLIAKEKIATFVCLFFSLFLVSLVFPLPFFITNNAIQPNNKIKYFSLVIRVGVVPMALQCSICHPTQPNGSRRITLFYVHIINVSVLFISFVQSSLSYIFCSYPFFCSLILVEIKHTVQ